MEIVNRGSSTYRLRGYIGGLEDLAVSLGVDMGEARLVRLSVMGMFEDGFSKAECVSGLVSRGYDGVVIGFEYLRCSEISGEIHSRVQRKIVKKDVAMQMFRDRVMCVGIDGGEMSKDEIVGVLSGVIMDGRVDVRSKLSAIELLGKYRDYYKSVDRDIRVIIESAKPASILVDDGVGVGVIPDGVEINGKIGGLGE